MGEYERIIIGKTELWRRYMNKKLWIKDITHLWITPGGDPVWVCPVCGGGQHVYGIENPHRQSKCKDCGAKIEGYKYDKR